MPSVAIPPSSNTVATATAAGIVTITNAVNVFPGAWGWITKTDGSAQKRVKVLSVSVSGTTSTLKCQVYPDNADSYGFGQAGFSPQYTESDLSAFNTGSALMLEAGTVPIDPAFSIRNLPA